MALITTLATLKTAVLDHLHRSDISSSSGGTLEILIAQAEQRFQRDPRIREPGSNNSVLPSLMTTDPNWLLTAEQDIYLYGTLVECAGYLRDYDALPMWEQRLQDAIDKLSGSVRLNPARSLALTSYAELQTMAADALNRGDMKNVIPVCIVMAEKMMATDDRIRSQTTATYSITGDDIAVPTGFRKLDSWYYDSSPYEVIKTVDAASLGQMKANYGLSGRPRYAAIIAASTFRFAPAPDTTYSTKMVYWRTLTALASGVNWLYTANPAIYLWATLTQCGPWVRGDVKAEQTVMEAKEQYEKLAEAMHMETWDATYSGVMRASLYDPIGG